MNTQNFRKQLKKILDTPFSAYSAIATFVSIILIRLLVEQWIDQFHLRSLTFYFFEFTHTILFFFLLFVICIILTVYIAKINKKTASIIFLFGFLLIIIPPVLDHIISTAYFNKADFLSYYLFDTPKGLLDSFLTFFGNKPRDGITYGTRIMIALAIILLSLLTWLNTKNIPRTLLMIFLSYTIFFLLSSTPTILAYIFTSNHLNTVASDVASFVASPTTILTKPIESPVSSINIKMSLFYVLINIFVLLLLSYKLYKKQFLSILKNIRPIQTLYHLGLLFIGFGIAIMFDNAFILPSFFTIIAFVLLCIAVILSWISTVILNDCVDEKIDIISNPTRPLVTGIIDKDSYKMIGISLAILSIFIAAIVSPYAIIPLSSYHVLSFLYNTPPLRLKRFPIIATFIASIASFCIVILGFVTVSPQHSTESFPINIAILLIVSYTISLPIKDLKDIEGDKANNIYTIPVLFGQSAARLIIGIGIFTSFMLSIVTLGTYNLIIPALIAGGLSFWTLVGKKNNKFIFTPKQILNIIFLIVFVYGIMLAYSLFN